MLAGVAVVSERSSGFTSSMQLASSSSMTPQRSVADDASLVQAMLEQHRLMLEREDKLRQEMESKIEKMQERADANLAKMCEEMKPAEAISEQRIAALQARLEALHAAKLLGDDELYALEDMVADYVEHKASMGGVVVTFEMLNGNENASKLLKLAALSESIAADGAFARQARRKYV